MEIEGTTGIVTCPNCNTRFLIDLTDEGYDPRIGGGPEEFVSLYRCANCAQLIIYLQLKVDVDGGESVMIYPPIRNDYHERVVPPPIWKEFVAARQFVFASPNASATMSRRCLQILLRNHFGFHARTLDEQIKGILGTAHLPSFLKSELDVIRTLGNFGAHPTPHAESGEIIEVERAEAKWLIQVLEALFDYCFAAPVQASLRRQAINKKLIAAGRRPLDQATVISFPAS
jgi:DNA-directed RNA polymerase subunit RPC12/RpoP